MNAYINFAGIIMNIKIITVTIFSSLLVILSFQIQRFSTSSDIKTSSSEFEEGFIPDNQDASHQRIWSADIQAIIKQLSEGYADKIHLIHIQAKLISVRESLFDHLPQPINKNLKSVLAITFPSHENSILEVWSKMDQYEEWLMAQNRTLMELDDLNRSGFLWQKRNELFPIAATDIWNEEQDLYETAQLNFHREVDQLDQSFDLPMHKRIERLQASFQQADNVFTRTLGADSGIHKNTVASVLFGLNSVQKELQQLAPEHRQLEIEAIRRELGFDEDTIIKMSNLDIKREQRWSNGYAYMASRNQLLANNESVSSTELDALRTQFFGNSAETIAREEMSGFYRFQRTRYYGRN